MSSYLLLNNPQLSWRDDGQPIATAFCDPYFSVENGLEESRYVFLQHNFLVKRWALWPWQQQNSFNILETGFGTGLNFLLTWQQWQQKNQQAGWLHFSSIEKYPLSQEQLKKALQLWPELGELAAKLLAVYPLPLQGVHHFTWPQERVSLTLFFMDVQEALPQCSGPVHAWYLDGFAPSRNSEMWSDKLFTQIRLLSQKHSAPSNDCLVATFATFTAAGVVKRGLIGAGFSVQKSKGFGRKREMLFGHFNRTQGPELPPYFQHKPWQLYATPPTQSVTVIGAGLAGCTTARALAERGIRVLVVDANGVAQGGSGNPQGGVYIKLAADDQAVHTEFYLASYLYALAYLKRHVQFNPCGMLQLGKFSIPVLPPSIVEPLTAEQILQRFGIEVTSPGLFFPEGGWIKPQQLCEALLQHPNIEFQPLKVQSLEFDNSHWLLQTPVGQLKSSHLVLAGAYESLALLDMPIPLKKIRGQLTLVDAKLAPSLDTVVSGRNYIAPECDGKISIGATFDINDSDPTLREKDHLANLEPLDDYGPDWQAFKNQQGLNAVVGGRVGFRCAAPDYLPVAGAVPDSNAFANDFAALAKDSNRIPKVPLTNLPNLWVNLGHGAKGIVSTPLCAEILASLITNDALPCSQDVFEALWPGRFLKRDLIRGKLKKAP